VSLRLQLLAVSLLTLVLPWVGLLYVQEMEAALRTGLEQSLAASAGAVAAALEEQSALCAPPDCDSRRAGTPIYATALTREPELDGIRDDEWNMAPEAALPIGDDHRLWAGTYDRFAYLFLAAVDNDIVYRSQPGQTPYGDRVVLAADPGIAQWWLLSTAAPGTFRAQETSPDAFEPSDVYDGRIIGAWRQTAGGYTLEVRVPLTAIGDALAVAIIDVDRGAGDYVVTGVAATWDEATRAAGRFIRQRAELQSLLGQFARVGGRFRVLDEDGWVLAATGSVTPGTAEGGGAGLLDGLFRSLLEREDPPYPPERPAGRIADATLRQALRGIATTAWYGSGPEREAIVAAAVPINGAAGVDGAVLLEQASQPILTLTNRALVRLMTVTLLVTLVVGAGLLGYATWLSLRVQRLAGAARTALGPRGEIRSGMPGAAAADELGALARSFAELLERLREHTEYLRTLASKLSHELRTPLAVVTTSLDNLEHEVKAPAAEEYLGRLRQGAERLDAILAAMSEATELEQAIRETAAQPFDLVAVVASCCAAYRDVYPEREIAVRCDVPEATVTGSGELVAQLLDKLVDNAVSFSPPGSRIDVTLTAAGDELVLAVTNHGPPLPAKMRGRLFDSLVSIREQRDGRPHLGLGLHIVALIADFHGGRCEADDLPDGSGVVFRVVLPKR
jgi:dedicated sortase system histidine kinase